MQPAQSEKAIWLASKAMVQSSVVDCCSLKAASPHSAQFRPLANVVSTTGLWLAGELQSLCADQADRKGLRGKANFTDRIDRSITKTPCRWRSRQSA